MTAEASVYSRRAPMDLCLSPQKSPSTIASTTKCTPVMRATTVRYVPGTLWTTNVQMWVSPFLCEILDDQVSKSRFRNTRFILTQCLLVDHREGTNAYPALAPTLAFSRLDGVLTHAKNLTPQVQYAATCQHTIRAVPTLYVTCRNAPSSKRLRWTSRACLVVSGVVSTASEAVAPTLTQRAPR